MRSRKSSASDSFLQFIAVIAIITVSVLVIENHSFAASVTKSQTATSSQIH